MINSSLILVHIVNYFSISITNSTTYYTTYKLIVKYHNYSKLLFALSDLSISLLVCFVKYFFLFCFFKLFTLLLTNYFLCF